MNQQKMLSILLILLTALHDKNLAAISSLGKISGTALKLFDYLEGSPIIEIKRTAQDLKMSYNGIANAVKALINNGLLIETEKSGRSRQFAYDAYLEILRKDIQ